MITVQRLIKNKKAANRGGLTKVNEEFNAVIATLEPPFPPKGAVPIATPPHTSEAVGPATGAVVDARDFDFRVAHSVGNDVGRLGYHEFAGAGDAAGRAELRIFRQQIFDAVEDVQGDALSGGRIMFGDVRAQGEKVVNGFRGPEERHTLLGAGRSLRVSQEATHSLTRAWAIPLPRSSDESALVMPATCHSLVSR
jgi:hypothetical protein